MGTRTSVLGVLLAAGLVLALSACGEAVENEPLAAGATTSPTQVAPEHPSSGPPQPIDDETRLKGEALMALQAGNERSFAGSWSDDAGLKLAVKRGSSDSFMTRARTAVEQNDAELVEVERSLNDLFELMPVVQTKIDEYDTAAGRELRSAPMMHVDYPTNSVVVALRDDEHFDELSAVVHAAAPEGVSVQRVDAGFSAGW